MATIDGEPEKNEWSGCFSKPPAGLRGCSRLRFDPTVNPRPFMLNGVCCSCPRVMHTGHGGAYVPPHRRAAAKRNNENSVVRVSNISKDTRESDLLELFRPFGVVHVSMNKKTGIAFVNFVNREDAQRAIHKLNGYLILRVEWATPTTTTT